MRALADLMEVLRRPGPWCMVHAEVSTGSVATLGRADTLGQVIARALSRAGAADPDARAAEGIDWTADGAASPASRFVLIHDGRVAVNEVLPGAPTLPFVEIAPIPDLLPLAAVRGSDVDYLVVEAERADAEISRHRASAARSAVRHEVHGITENITKVPLGGYSQGKYQHRTEEIWRRNGADVAAEVNRLVDDGGVQLVVLAGDERARTKVRGALSERALRLARTIDMNSLAPGGGRARFEEEVSAVVAGVAARRQRETLERLVAGLGSHAAGDWSETFRALQEGRVDTLLLCPSAAEGQRLVALGTEPWLAETEDGAIGAPVLGVAGTAATLLRAAVLTRAETVLYPAGMLDGDVAAALLRW